MGFNIGIKDIIDILLVAILLYQTYKLLKKTGAANVFIGILTFIVIWFLISYVFKLELLGGILNKVASVGAFGLIVLFQDEIKRFFSRLGSRRNWKFINVLKRLFGEKKIDNNESNSELAQIAVACRNLSKSSTGALIVIKREIDLGLYIQSGETINANINTRLIENIFFKNSPLHDGAMIIANWRIKAAGCILPVSKNQDIPRSLGLRHRAAIGITETTDSVAIVVSEEAGKISWAVNGKITVNVNPEELERFLFDTIVMDSR